MNTKTLLILSTVLLVVILGYMAYQETQKPKTPGEQFQESMEDAGDAIGDAIDDITQPEPKNAGDAVGEAVEDAGEKIQDAAQ